MPILIGFLCSSRVSALASSFPHRLSGAFGATVIGTCDPKAVWAMTVMAVFWAMLLWTRSVAKEFGSLFKLIGSGAGLFVEGGTLGYCPVSPASWFHLQERGAAPSHSPLEQPDRIHQILFFFPQGVWFCRQEPELFVSW